MPKNLTGGNKHKKGKNSTHKVTRAIIYPDNKITLFAYVLGALGDCKFHIRCNDDQNRIGVVRGSLYKNTFINVGDLVLVGLRDFSTATSKSGKEFCDIIMKYTSDEMNEIQKNNILTCKGSSKPFVNNLDLNKSRLNDQISIFDRNPNENNLDSDSESQEESKTNIVNKLEKIKIQTEDESDSELSINIDDI